MKQNFSIDEKQFFFFAKWKFKVNVSDPIIKIREKKLEMH